MSASGPGARARVLPRICADGMSTGSTGRRWRRGAPPRTILESCSSCGPAMSVLRPADRPPRETKCEATASAAIGCTRARCELERTDPGLCGHLTGELVELRRADDRHGTDAREYSSSWASLPAVAVRDPVDADDRQQNGVPNTGAPRRRGVCRMPRGRTPWHPSRSSSRDARASITASAPSSMPTSPLPWRDRRRRSARGRRRRALVVRPPRDESSHSARSSRDGDPHAYVLLVLRCLVHLSDDAARRM
jgi:hypothetical protein